MEATLTKREPFNETIRPFREEDIPALREISEHWLQDDGVIAYDEVEKDMDTCRQSLVEESGIFMFVAESPDGKVIGMMGLSEIPKQPLLQFKQTDNPCELIVAYVHPDYVKGKGVGTALINAVLDLARSKGKIEILVESGPRHIETGHPFYDRQGFERVGRIPDFYGPGADSQVWRNSLEGY